MDDKIDFVVTWVDDNDLNWQIEKDKYSSDEINPKLNGKSRYRDFDIFKYWFRAVEENAPWVNRVFLVTNGTTPDWINESNSKLKLINHKDFMPADSLPTFNSNAIEMSVHKIPELSEHFVLFNDDTFLNHSVLPDSFFHNGLPRDLYFESPIIPATGTIVHTIVNDMIVINDYFNKKDFYKNNFSKVFNFRGGLNLLRTIALIPGHQFCGIWNSHLPISYRKSIWNDVGKKEPELFKRTIHHRFRNDGDINHWLIRYWQLVSGNFYPRRKSFGKNYNLTSGNVQNIIHDIDDAKHSLICINDTEELTDFVHVSDQLKNAFEKRYPKVSNFEK